MTKNSDKTEPAREKSPWFQIAQFLFLVGLAVAVFLLAQSMVHHRFFRGRLGQPERHSQTIAGAERVLDAAPKDASYTFLEMSILIQNAHSQSAMLL